MSNLTYTQKGDYWIPNVTLCEQDHLPIGKYGRMRKAYLRQHRPILFNALAISGKLQAHLFETERTAQQRLEQMMNQMKKKAGVTEQLKAENLMEWVGRMNTLKHQAEEIILNELIYN